MVHLNIRIDFHNRNFKRLPILPFLKQLRIVIISVFDLDIITQLFQTSPLLTDLYLDFIHQTKDLWPLLEILEQKISNSKLQNL